MYVFLLRCWIEGRVTATQINYAVTRGWITQEEANTILTTPQEPTA